MGVSNDLSKKSTLLNLGEAGFNGAKLCCVTRKPAKIKNTGRKIAFDNVFRIILLKSFAYVLEQSSGGALKKRHS